MKKGTTCSILIVLLVGLIAAAASAETTVRYRVEISTTDTAALMRTLEQENFDVAGSDPAAGTVDVIVSASQIRQLAAMGLKIRIMGSGSRSIPPGYRDFFTILSLLNDYQQNYPALAKNFNISAYTGEGTTYEDRPMHALKISDNVDADEDEPAILIVANHHAREIVTPELALHAIDQLLSSYGTDPNITKLVDENEIWVAPCWNPDGLVYCWTTYDYWRKNRTPFGSDYGVDLNRNYPFNWDGPAGGSTYPSSDTYRGPYAASEQETQNMLALARERRFAKVLDFHSSGREVLYTYYYSSSFPTILENWFSSKATEFSYALGYNGWKRKPSAEGEHFQWELCELGSFAFLVETATEFQPSYNAALAEATLTWPGVLWFLEHEIPLKGHVTEAGTGTPLVADITVSGINYTQGETRQTGGPFGRFHYFLPPGSYSVTFSASGYPSRTVPVTITAGESTTLETQLGDEPALTVTGHVAVGETIDLSFDWPAGAGQRYANGVSYIDTGFTFNNGLFFPIGLDNLLMQTGGKLPGWKGVLDSSGHASAVLDIPGNPGLAGTTIYMAFLTFVSNYKDPTNASAAVKLVIEG